MSAGGSSGLAGAIGFGIYFIVRMIIRASGPDGSEFVTAMEKMIEQQKAIMQVTQETKQQLAKIQDADTAVASVADIKSTFTKWQEAKDSFEIDTSDVSLTSLLKISEANMKKMEELGEEEVALLEKDSALKIQIAAEIDRIRELPDLPAEFWVEMRAELARQSAILYEESAEYLDEDQYLDVPNPAIYEKLADQIEQHGSNRVVLIHLSDVPGKDFNKVCNELRETSGKDVTLTRWHNSGLEEGHIVMAPTEEFEAFLEMLPEGDFKTNDAVRRTISLKVDVAKEQEKLEQAKKLAEAAERAAAEAARKAEEAKLPPEEQQVDESEIDYYRRIAGLMIESEERGLSKKVLDKLLTIEPDQVSDKKTRGQIARNFRQLALEENNGSSQGVAIQGLARYGGKYSVPILLQMHEEGKINARQEFFEVLALYPHEKTAEVLVKQLEESSRNQEVVDCLRQMGPVAEVPLIKIARSEDKNLTLTVVELLGDVGTTKSFAILRKHTKSKDKKLSETAKQSTLSIRKRLREEKQTKAKS